VSERVLETQLRVSRQFFRSGKEVSRAKETEETIDVHRFVTEPAKVMVEMGMTVNLGNFESARVSASLTVPCYLEEHEDAYAYARKFVETRVIDEAKEAKRFAQGRSSSSF
jgi:hypothetical protein